MYTELSKSDYLDSTAQFITKQSTIIHADTYQD